MNRGHGWMVGLAVFLLWGGLSRGQGVYHADAGALGGQVTLIPEVLPDGRTGPLFLGDGTVPGLAGRTRGTVVGTGISKLGDIQIGFDYLRPFWSFRDFMLAVPPAYASRFPPLGGTGHVDNHFAFAPRLNYNYDLEELGIDLRASGTFLNLSGRLQRQVSSAGGGFGELTANNSLTIVVANLIEVGRGFYYTELKNKRPWIEGLEDMVIDLSVGSRFSSLDQNYTGSLTSGAGGTSVASRYATQSFRGFGLTTAAKFLDPVGEDWIVYTSMRGSLLIGENRKESTLLVNAGGLPPVSEVISQTQTSVIPVLEVELGVEWGAGLAEWLRDLGLRADSPRAELTKPILTLRAALVGQFWGNAGPLSAGSNQGFRSSDLFLAGAHVMVGFHR